MNKAGNRFMCLVILGFLLLPAAIPWAENPQEADRQSLSEPIYDVLVQKNVPIPMRDGTALIADLYFPAKNNQILEGKLGTLLQRSPYNKEGEGNVRLGNRYASMGFAVMLQDERGCELQLRICLNIILL